MCTGSARGRVGQYNRNPRKASGRGFPGELSSRMSMMVRKGGLEPPRREALEPKSSASTNSATFAASPPESPSKCNIINTLLSGLALVSLANPLFFQAIFSVSVGHYENFPVASVALPRSLRRPVKAIYAFARSADDFADEGNASPSVRLEALNAYRSQLDRLCSNAGSDDPLFQELSSQIGKWHLPVQPFYDLLDAFSQDVVKSRYANFGEVMHYCRRSANPVGRLMLHLFGQADARALAYSDGICSALQLINFLQDVGVDWAKDRVYLPQDELAKAGLNEVMLGKLIGESATCARPTPQFEMTSKPVAGIPVISFQSSLESRWRGFMLSQIDRTRKILQAGAPLGLILPGRIGFELRLIIAGGDRILRKLHVDPMASLRRRPTLNPWDWVVMLTRSLFKR
jgi:squalene synthase HpnC